MRAQKTFSGLAFSYAVRAYFLGCGFTNLQLQQSHEVLQLHAQELPVKLVQHAFVGESLIYEQLVQHKAS